MKRGSGRSVTRADSTIGTESPSAGGVDRMADVRRFVFGGAG
jgi:hypothetical protein